MSESESVTKAKSGHMSSTISMVLIGGLTLSVILVIVGEFVSLSRYASFITHYRIFNGEPSDYRTIEGVIRDVFHGKARAIIQLGIVVLMATPVVRVAFSLLAFGLEGDRKYVLISAFVLCTLMYSLLSST